MAFQNVTILPGHRPEVAPTCAFDNSPRAKIALVACHERPLGPTALKQLQAFAEHVSCIPTAAVLGQDAVAEMATVSEIIIELVAH